MPKSREWPYNENITQLFKNKFVRNFNDKNRLYNIYVTISIIQSFIYTLHMIYVERQRRGGVVGRKREKSGIKYTIMW